MNTMFPQEKVIVDDERLHERKHQQHRLDHTKDTINKFLIKNNNNNNIPWNYSIIKSIYNDEKIIHHIED